MGSHRRLVSRRHVVPAALWSSAAKRANAELPACLSVPPRCVLCPAAREEEAGRGLRPQRPLSPLFPSLGGAANSRASSGEGFRRRAGPGRSGVGGPRWGGAGRQGHRTETGPRPASRGGPGPRSSAPPAVPLLLCTCISGTSPGVRTPPLLGVPGLFGKAQRHVWLSGLRVSSSAGREILLNVHDVRGLGGHLEAALLPLLVVWSR